jgi:FdhE protein
MTELVRPLNLVRPGAPGDARRRLAELRRERPEWERWFALHEVVLDVAGDPAWEAAAAAAELRVAREPGAPLLQGATLSLAGPVVQAFLRRLLAAAEFGDEPADTGALIAAAVNQDASLDPALAVAAGWAAMPVLRSLNRRFGGTAAAGWEHGYCPVCGAWPAMIEQRGLERERRLRCGRCGADWGAIAHRCVFCGENDHNRLGALVADETGEARRIETCGTCHGYVKVLAALRPASSDELSLDDLATIELDLAALERGFRRPEAPAVALGVTIGLSEGVDA